MDICSTIDMVDNSGMGAAKTGKKDEFYTQYHDIEAEMNAYIESDPDVFRGKTILLPCDDPEWSEFTRYFATNFERFGLKKLISTSYAKGAANKQTTLFEFNSPLYDREKHDTHGKLFILSRDVDNSGIIDVEDIEFTGYLKGDGDFNSKEVTKLRDESDIIITNPPFSQFRQFIAWVMEGKKQFIILANINAVTYKEVFPYIKENKLWLGSSIHSGDREFRVPSDYPLNAASYRTDDDGNNYIRVKGVRWFTNIDYIGRHELLLLDTMEHNLKFNKSLRKKFVEEYGALEYPVYDNFDAIDIPFTECIPSDYDGIMGVPVTFMDKYNPDQFEILGCADYTGKYGSDELGISRIGEKWISKYKEGGGKGHYTANMTSLVFYGGNGEAFPTFKRILIRPKKIGGNN